MLFLQAVLGAADEAQKSAGQQLFCLPEYRAGAGLRGVSRSGFTAPHEKRRCPGSALAFLFSRQTVFRIKPAVSDNSYMFCALRLALCRHAVI